ncbi:MAG: type II toxin-antitoxin system ParD family antitoxin [Chthoniobacteraceae bacterium]|jgi:antitoxin ParD1/3/4
MTTLVISINEKDRRFLEDIVKSGRYLSESEVVAEALSELKVRESIRQNRLAELRAKIDVGIDQADRGDFVEFTAEDVIVEGRKRLATQKAGS